jgi:catechol 2,3-dioxygenase-like lactoylglutathione lyase family enzyme
MAYKHYHTHFTSREPEKAVEFYQRMFGAKVLRSFVLYGGVNIWDLDVGGLMLRISGSTGAEESGGVTERLYGLHHLGLLTDNLEQAVAELKSKGAEFVAEPTSSRPGLKYAFLRAPENTFVELVEMADEELGKYGISSDWTEGEV